ncbi:MAG: 4Fe-4S dicluster domain-containing protein, partial [candidate division Zixibacteria bacterium]|nr:4Fe-4S dicluster domain-containing protein [candidate division Zixibacteria bacterium]
LRIHDKLIMAKVKPFDKNLLLFSLTSMITKAINYKFKEKLNSTIGGEAHNFCYQCGACVGDCPAAMYSPEFNPREILLKAILGDEEALTGENSPIWDCTNCYTCYERCPQAVRPVEVIIALKNICFEKGTNPLEVKDIVDSVKDTGRTVKITSLSDRRRKELGLKEVKIVPMEELRKLFEP